MDSTTTTTWTELCPKALDKVLGSAFYPWVDLPFCSLNSHHEEGH